MSAYYNEIDPYAAQWLRNLIAVGHIADGVVDTRSISDVEPNDLREFTQCHFFAGIGVWSHALRLAGWPDSRPVWTGSCPCQPFSVAGRSGGFTDERHLWPHWHHLIAECRPRVVFGEQVASKDGLTWLDLVHADVEGEGYAFGAFDLCAAGVGAPHIRQRLYFVADTDNQRRARVGVLLQREEPGRVTQDSPQATGGGSASGLADTESHGQQRGALRTAGGLPPHGVAQNRGLSELAQPHRDGHDRTPGHAAKPCSYGTGNGLSERGSGELCGAAPGPTNGHWRAADWVYCRDYKWRAVEPGAFPLAHGATSRVGRLRAYGNAIVPQVAAEVISAYLEVTP